MTTIMGAGGDNDKGLRSFRYPANSRNQLCAETGVSGLDDGLNSVSDELEFAMLEGC